MEITFRRFIESSDLSLYIKGEIESFKASFPLLELTKEVEYSLIRNLDNLSEEYIWNAYTFTHDENPIGYISLKQDSTPSGEVYYINNIYLLKEYRGKGISKKMIELAYIVAQNKKLIAIQLDVFKCNIYAIRLYNSLGFERISYRMEKKIPSIIVKSERSN